MNKKYLIKLKDDTVKGPFLENEIDDMIYEGLVAGEEKIKEYPEGEWTDIAKVNHFYDVFMGAFELQKGSSKNKKDTFVESPTRADINQKTIAKKTEDKKDSVVKKSKQAKKQQAVEETQLYTREDIKEVSDSLIKKTTKEVIDTEQKSPLIPQAVIVSLDEKRDEDKNRLSLNKMALISVSSVILLGIILIIALQKPSVTPGTINIDGTIFNKTFVEITLPVAESSEYNPSEAKKLTKEALKLMKQDDVPSYKRSVELLLKAFENDTSNSSILSYLAYGYERLYNVSKKDMEYINALRSIISRSEKIDPNIQTLYTAKIEFENIQKNYNSGIAEFNTLMTSLKDPSKVSNQVLLVTAHSAIGSNDYNSAYQIVTRINRSSDDTAMSHYLEGIIRTNNKETELAVSSFEEALNKNPKHYSSIVKLFELGKNASINNIFELIKTNYKEMFHDDVSICLYLIGNILVQNNQEDKAKYFYQKALDFSPDNIKAMITYEQLGGNIGKYKKDTIPGIASSSEVTTFLLRGDELFNTQKYRDASLQYRMAASLGPNNANAWYKLGEAYRMTYEYGKAIEAYEESLKLDKMNVSTIVKLARVQSELFKFKDASENLKKAQQIDPDNPDVLFSIGYLNDKRKAGDEEIIKYYHRAIANDFSHVDANLEIGKKTFDYERYVEAKLSFEKVLSKQPDNFDAYMYITRITAKTDYINKAERYVENLEKIFPDIAEITTGLALAYMDMANYSMAEKTLKKALNKNKYSIATLKAYGKLCERLGKTKDALGYYETISIIAPYNLDAINRKVNIYHQLGQQTNTERELKKLLFLAPEYPYANYTLGKLYYNSGQYESADIALNNEIKNNPFIRDSYLLLGDVYIKQNKPDMAIELFQKMLRANRKDPYAFMGLAMASYAAKDFSGAESYITQARHLDPSIDRIYFLECKLFFDQKMYSEAKNSCEEYIKRAPNDFDAPEAKEILQKIL